MWSTRKILIALFVGAHFFCIPIWSLFNSGALAERVNKIVKPYFWASGLWQGWAMFAPNPLSTNIALDARLVFEDATEMWIGPFPNTHQRPWFQKYLMERFRKWSVDWVRQDKNKSIWPDAALYIVRQVEREKQKKVIEVHLIRRWADIPRIQMDKFWQENQGLYPLTNAYEFFALKRSGANDFETMPIDKSISKESSSQDEGEASEVDP